MFYQNITPDLLWKKEQLNISQYYEEISKEPLIDREEEADLFLLLEDAGLHPDEKEKIRERIIRANLRFPFKMAKKYSKGDPEVFAELIGAGNEGLLVAMNKFDPTRGYRFLSYAGFWVLQRILKVLSGFRIVSLPIYRQQLASRIQKFQVTNEKTTLEDLKKEFPKVPLKDLKELSETRFLTYHLEDMTGDPSLEIDPITNDVEAKIDRENIHDIVNTLPSPHKEIVFRLFGLKDGKEWTHTEISRDLNISKESLRIYKKEAFAILHESLKDHNID